MTWLPPPADRRRLRAADADRRHTAEALRQAAAEGRLTLDELSERLRLVHAARTVAALESVTSDLPGPGVAAPLTRTAPSLPAAPDESQADMVSLAVMGDARRAGAWAVPPTHTAVAIIGWAELDLREAELAARETTIEAYCLMGGVRVIVRDDVQVDVRGFGIVGGFRRDARWRGSPGAPRVRVTGFALLGEVEICRASQVPPRGDRAAR